MNRLFLIGPMGSGKTTVGRFLAGRLGLEFLDLDQEIERRCGVDVSMIFDIEGEAGFRAREQAMLDELTQRDGILLATGGGTVLAENNRRMLRERGLVVWLQTRVEQQLKRLERDQRRPLLQAPDRRERLERLADARNPLYADCAHLVVRSANVSPAQMAARAEQQIQEFLRSERTS
jgi:shikimate kinase